MVVLRQHGIFMQLFTYLPLSAECRIDASHVDDPLLRHDHYGVNVTLIP